MLITTIWSTFSEILQSSISSALANLNIIILYMRVKLWQFIMSYGYIFDPVNWLGYYYLFLHVQGNINQSHKNTSSKEVPKTPSLMELFGKPPKLILNLWTNDSSFHHCVNKQHYQSRMQMPFRTVVSWKETRNVYKRLIGRLMLH